MHCFDTIGNVKQQTIQSIINGPVLAEIKQTMAAGQWHPFCRLCKENEDNTGASARTVRFADADTVANIDQAIDWFELQHIVINWSNLCNLSCTYCNPQTSTAWQSVKKIPIQHVKNEHQDLIELARTHGHKIQGLTLGGGEPLLQKGLVDFLKCLLPQNVCVLVTTNLSMDLSTNPVYQELRKWPNVEWQISFDNCTKEKFEYVRDRASWAQFENNIELMQQDGQYIKAHPAYSVYCAFDLVEYYEYCDAKNLDIFWCQLDHPWDLDCRRLSKPLRDIAVAQIDQVSKRWAHKNGMAINTLQQYRANLIDNAYIVNVDTYFANPLDYSQRVEKELSKTNTFGQVWPDLTEKLKRFHYAKNTSN
jgi:organic radical activating enzyme